MFRAVALLITVKCFSVTYPVLVSVSRNYPGHMGRLPTCYSPVRHWEVSVFQCKHLLSGFSVRLACIRHAASVHPEPGSNSPFDLALDVSYWHHFFFFLIVSKLTWIFFSVLVSLYFLFLFSFQRSFRTSLTCSSILPNIFASRKYFFNLHYFHFFTHYFHKNSIINSYLTIP